MTLESQLRQLKLEKALLIEKLEQNEWQAHDIFLLGLTQLQISLLEKSIIRLTENTLNEN